jgi:exodeoxyribonuclease VII small subunit
VKTDRSASDKPAPDNPGQAPSFETAMNRLSEIVDQLESGELPLDASLRLFEEGVGLSKAAGDLLEAAERKVEALTRTADGSLGTVPFDVVDEGDER